MPDVVTVGLALLAGLAIVVVLDVVRRAYLLSFHASSYKRDDETDGDVYALEKREEALDILSQYWLTRWLVEGYRRSR